MSIKSEIKDYKIAMKREKGRGKKKLSLQYRHNVCMKKKKKKSEETLTMREKKKKKRIHQKKKENDSFLCKSKILYSSRTFYTMINISNKLYTVYFLDHSY